MVAIFTGAGMGLQRGSANILGGTGALGDASLGRGNEGAYVNAATGNLVLNNRDEFLVGLGPDSAFNRTYNSLGQMTDENGDNWATFGSAITGHTGTYNSSGAYVDRRDWDGDIVRYYYDTSKSAYITKEGAGAYDQLTYSGGNWTWKDGDSGLTESYSASYSNRVVAKTDRDGNAITYSYASSTGNLTSVTTADGNYTDLSWSGNNLTALVTTYTDPQGATKTLTRTRYAYDGSNRLTTVTVDLSPEDSAVSDGRTYVTSYGYDGTSKRIASIAQTDGTLLSFTYDGSGRVATFVQTVDGSTTRTTTFTYGSGSTTITDPQGNAATLYYDSAGQLTKLVEPAPVSGGNVATTTYEYNANGDVTRIRKYDGAASGSPISEENFAYDANGNLLEHVDATNHTTIWTYGTSNEVLTKTTYTGIDPDGLGGSAPSGGMTERYVYDSELHLRFVVSPEERVRMLRYNADGTQRLNFVLTGQLYTDATFTEAALDAWFLNLQNQNALTNAAERTDITYDFRGNISTIAKYSQIFGAGGGVTTADYALTTYVYDQYGKLLSKVSNDSGAVAETYAYDGMGRAIRFTDAKGVGTWTSYIDAKARTVTTLASGLTTTSVYNRAGELIASSEARGGVATENLQPDLTTWNYAGSIASTAAGQVDGSPARKFTNGTSSTAAVASQSFSVAAGETVTISMSFMASGSLYNTAAFGLYGYGNGWGANNYATARIISGPGFLYQLAGGLWGVTGLSTTEATRIEITRFFDSNEQVDARFYLPETAGQASVASAPSIIKSRYDALGHSSFDNSQFDISNWGSGGVTRSTAAAIDGAPAATYTINQTGEWSGVYSGFYGEAGDTITASVSLMAVGSGNSASFGIYGNTTGWGSGFESTSIARIISGPGTLTQEEGGLWNITGLSASQTTRIEIVRTLTQTESGGVYLYPERPNGWIASRSITAGAVSIIRTPGAQTTYKYDSLGRLRIKTDPAGTRTFYFYDKRGRQIAQIDGDGSVTEYKYDSADNVAATVVFANTLNTTQLASLYDWQGNPTSVEFASIRPSANGDDRWNWNIYDKAGRLIQMIDAAGFSTSFLYDGAARLVKTTRYYYAVSHYLPSLLDQYKTTPPTTFEQAPWDSSVDRTTFNYYDNDGLLIGSVDEEMFVTEYLYDDAGREIETIRYANAASTSYQPVGAFNSALPASWASIKASVAPNVTDIHNYSLYDGRGLVGATIDGEGNVTRYHYNARGLVAQGIVGGKVTPNTQYTLASLPAVSGTFDITNYQYDVRGQLTLEQKVLLGGNYENTSYVYDSGGNLVSQTTSETVSSDTRSITFRYDAQGRLIGELSGNGSPALAALGTNPSQAQIDNIYATYGTRYVYDAADRLIQKITPDGSGSTGSRTLYYYDKDGQLRYEINALGETVEYCYNTLEEHTDSIVYGTRINVAGFTGGLVDSAIANAVAAIANSAVDSRSQASFDARGLIANAFDPLFVAEPTMSHYDIRNYNAFGEITTYYSPFDGVDWQVEANGNYRRGLKYLNYQYLNGEHSGAVQTTYTYDAFGRVQTAYSNNTDWRRHTYYYDRNGQQTYDYDDSSHYRYFTYDPRSNLISSHDRTSNVTTYAYDQHNRTVTTTTAEGITSTVVKNAYGQTISITDGAGRVTSYTYDKNGNLKTVTDAAGTVINNYDNADHLMETIDGRGTNTVFTYDAIGRVLTKVEDAGSGHLNITTSYAYDAKGQQISVTDALGSVTTFTYDLKGQKTRIIQDAGSGKLNLTTDYVYRADGKVISMTEAVGTSAARTISYVYDSMGRLTEQHLDPNGLNLTTKYAYDVNNNIIATTDEQNLVTRFVYDGENRQIFSINAMGEVTETGYDGEGRTIWTRGYANRIAISTVSGWSLEATEATVRASISASSSDHINRTMYDKDGRVAYKIDGEGYATRFIYDGANNLIKTIHYAVSVATSNESTKATNDAYFDTYWGTITNPHPTSAVTTFVYDGANRLTSTTDAEGYTESYTLDANGNRWRVTNKLGGVVEYGYDALGRLANEYVLGAVYNDSGTQIAAGYYANVYGHDALGRVVHHREAQGLTEQRDSFFQYDAAGRMVTKTLPSINIVDPSSGLYPVTGGRTETVKYDARGNVIEAIAVGGGRTLSYYDAADRKIAEINAIGTYTAFTYDAHGNLASQRVYGSAISLPGSAGGTPPSAPGGEYRETQFGYDSSDRLIQTRVKNVRTGSWNESSYVSSAGADLVSQLVYDALGNVVQEIDPNGGIVYHWYDRNGREYQKQDAEGYVTTWVRDGEGNVLIERRCVTRWNTTPHADDRITVFTYDKNGRRLSETRQNVMAATVNGSGVLSTPALTNATISYLYNGLGQVTRKTEANGDAINYAYDNQGRLTWQRAAAISDQNGITVYNQTRMFYDGLGNLVNTTEQGVDANGSYASGYSASTNHITRYHYGAGGMLQWTEQADGARMNYYYDIKGRMAGTLVEHARANGTALAARSWIYYDAVDRLYAEAKFSYGAVAGWDWGVTDITIHNAYGDVISKAINGNTQEEFYYDNAGRVIKSNAGDGSWKMFVYDGNGNATLTITSAGYDLSGVSVDTALGLIGQADVNGTYAVYDKRNMVVQTVEEGRQLSSGSTQALTSSRSYNPFGEVTSETDALGYTTDYLYNAMGRMIERKSPQISVTLENGTVQDMRPTENYYYDISGRMIASRDANGNLTRQLLLAGTGHEEGGPLVTKLFAADGGTITTDYDAYGNARRITDQLGRVTDQSFDKMGRVTQVSRAGGLVDYYAYDGLGQKIRHWNNVLSSGDAETTDYDVRGRVISTRAFGGDIITTSYSWNGSLSTAGLGTFGGWVATTTYANTKTSVSSTDSFGHQIGKTDMGGHGSSYSYDKAGRLTQSVTGSATTNYSWYNTGLTASIAGPSGTEAYEYDKLGRRTKEYMTDVTAAVVKNATATYNALGWLLTWAEAGSTATPGASTENGYDANGNIRFTKTTNKLLDAQGADLGYVSGAEYWFRYDSMNRVVTDKGSLSGTVGVSGTTIIRGIQGADILYNIAGQRVARLGVGYQQGASGVDERGDPVIIPGQAWEARESYSYDSAGNLTNVYYSQGAPVEDWELDGFEWPLPSAPTSGTLLASYSYDLLGRVTAQADYMYGSTVVYSRAVTYNAAGQITVDDSSTKRGSDTYRAYATYNYGSGSTYALGGAISVTTVNYKNGNDSAAADTLSTTSYAWWDGAVQSSVTSDSDTGSSSNPIYTTTYSYNGVGQLISAYIGDGRPRTVTFINDASGQVIDRDEADANSSTGDPRDIWYRFAGKQLGHVSNNGTPEMSYGMSMSDRATTPPPTPGPFRNGSTYSYASADFAQSLSPINSYDQGSSSGSYTVGAGDSLSSIAASLYGDASLWYKIAEANGISASPSTGSGGLIAGQRLILPAGVLRNTHNASTSNPYDPASILGDTNPTTPKPGKNKCGVFGAVLMVVIAVAVTALTSGAALAALSGNVGTIGSGIATMLGTATGVTTGVGAGAFVAAGAIGGAVGSIASQGAGIAMGVQENINWKGVGLSALSGAIGGGIRAVGSNVANLDKLTKFGKAMNFITNGSSFGAGAARGLISGVISQGVSAATSLSDQFSWSGVAANALSSGVSTTLGSTLSNAWGNGLWGSVGNSAVSGMAGSIAHAATTSALDGTNFGDNILASLPDIIGSTIGNAIGRSLAARPNPFAPDALNKITDDLAKQRDKKVADLNKAWNEAERADDQKRMNKISGEINILNDDHYIGLNALSKLAIARYGKNAAQAKVTDLLDGQSNKYVRLVDKVDNNSFLYEAPEEIAAQQRQADEQSGVYFELDETGNRVPVELVVSYGPPDRISVDRDTTLGRVIVDGLIYTQDKIEAWGDIGKYSITAAKTVLTGGAAPLISLAIDKGVEKAIPYLPKPLLEVLAKGGEIVNDFVGGGGGSYLLDTDRDSVKVRDKGAVAWGAVTLFGVSVGAIAAKAHIAAKGASFNSFSALKRHLGSPGEGNEWHHIVEQSQIPDFGTHTIQSVDNVMAVPKDIHKRISGFYSSKQFFTEGKTVRQWLSGKSYEEQYQFGLEQIKRLSK